MEFAGARADGFSIKAKPRAFADRYAVALDVVGTARRARYEPQRVEAIQRREAQRVDAADHRGIADACRYHARRIAEDLGARGARRRDDKRGTFEAQVALHEIGQRKSVLRFGVVKIGGQGARLRVAAAIRELGLQDAGGARTHENADACRAVFFDGRSHRGGKTIELETQLREPVIAAVVGGEIGPNPHRVQSGDFSDKGVENDRFETAGRETRAPLAQRLGDRLPAGAEAVHDREMGDGERLQASRLSAADP